MLRSEIVEVLDAPRSVRLGGRHPYTRELALAVPIPDTDVARARAREMAE